VPASSATPAASEPKKSKSAKPAASLSRGRRITVWVLVVLASLLLLVSILTTWVKRQMLDNGAWNRATTQVIQDPQVQASLATFTVNQIYENINVGQALSQRLPPNLQRLGPPIAGALQAPATQGVKLLLQRPRVQQAFLTASTVAHEKLVNVLENKTGNGISTGNGVVTLNLHELVVEVATALGLPANAIAKLPANTGTVTLLKSDQLSAAQTGVQAIRTLSVWLLVAVLFLYGLAIYLARTSRRATIRNAGVAFAVVGLLVLIIRRLLGNYLVSALAAPGYQVATHRLYLIGTAILGQIGYAIVLYGVIATLGAVFAGPTRPAVWLRSRLAPILNNSPGIVWGSVAFLYLLAILWGGTHALRTWWGILLLGGLIALGLYALRQETLKEFPGGAPDTADGDMTAVQAHGAPRSAVSELSRLAELHRSGALTDEEFARAKKIALT
jgi:hypothetical protein